MELELLPTRRVGFYCLEEETCGEEGEVYGGCSCW